MYFSQDEYDDLLKALPAKALCHVCGGETTLVSKTRSERSMFFYLCLDSKCGANTEPFLVRIY